VTEGRGSWSGRITYLLLAVVLIVAPLLPLNTVPRAYATPDVLLAATAAWAARRPDTLPALMIVSVFLLTDFLFQRPPGLFTALVLLLTEWLRRRSTRIRKGSFPGEWLTVGTGMAIVVLANHMVLAVMVTTHAPIGLTLIQLLLTIALYPVIAGVAHLALGLRRPAQGEVDALGHRL
jgi:rod shape-determining protein MreD